MSHPWLIVANGASRLEVAIIPMGAHLESDRSGYSHHGIYVGCGQVIHYGGFHHHGQRSPVEYITLECFASGNPVRVVPEPNACYSGIQVAARAMSRLGENQYRLLTNNCEHFCSWCIQGFARSNQVRSFIRRPWRIIEAVKIIFLASRHGTEDNHHATARRTRRLIP